MSCTKPLSLFSCLTLYPFYFICLLISFIGAFFMTFLLFVERTLCEIGVIAKISTNYQASEILLTDLFDKSPFDDLEINKVSIDEIS